MKLRSDCGDLVITEVKLYVYCSRTEYSDTKDPRLRLTRLTEGQEPELEAVVETDTETREELLVIVESSPSG